MERLRGGVSTAKRRCFSSTPTRSNVTLWEVKRGRIKGSSFLFSSSSSFASEQAKQQPEKLLWNWRVLGICSSEGAHSQRWVADGAKDGGQGWDRKEERGGKGRALGVGRQASGADWL